MKFIYHISLSFLLPVMFAGAVYAQSGIPQEVSSIKGMTLEQGQNKLGELGYEVCASSLFGHKQDWFNESASVCITIKFDKKTELITEVLGNPATDDCRKGLEASRKVWENYHDGQAPATSPILEQERKKLSDQGYRVSYWINNVSPGRCSEYWVNESLQKTMFIVWEIQGNNWVMTDKTEYRMGKNPAPKK